jgi:uncharacterized protein
LVCTQLIFHGFEHIFIAVLVFHGLGFSFAGEMSSVLIYAFGLVLVFLQLLFCRWWLTPYTFGPCEWVWRQLTYGERIPLTYSVEKMTPLSYSVLYPMTPKGPWFWF